MWKVGSILYSSCVVFLQVFLSLWLGLVLIFILFLASPIFLYRYLLTVLAAAFRPDLGLMLSPQSRLFGHPSNPATNMSIQFRLSGKLNATPLVNRIREQCITLKDKSSGKFVFPEFQQYYTTWLGYAFWKNEENFQINAHFRHLVLKENKEVEPEFKRVLESPFPPHLSPWEITFVETKEDPNRHYIWFKFHHGLADGFSIFKALMGAADSEVHQLRRTAGEDSEVSWTTKVLGGINSLCAIPEMIRLGRGGWDAQGLTGLHHTTFTEAIALSLIKQLSQKFGVSVSAILISAVTGAIRKRLLTDGVCIPKSGVRGITLIPLPHHSNNLTNRL